MMVVSELSWHTPHTRARHTLELCLPCSVGPLPACPPGRLPNHKSSDRHHYISLQPDLQPLTQGICNFLSYPSIELHLRPQVLRFPCRVAPSGRMEISQTTRLHICHSMIAGIYNTLQLAYKRRVTQFVAGSMSLVLRQHACNNEYHLMTYERARLSLPDRTWNLITAYLAHSSPEQNNLLCKQGLKSPPLGAWWGWSHLTAGSCSISR